MTRRPQFGPLIDANGVTFRLWAPAARHVSLMLDRPHVMERHGDWFTLHRRDARPGTRYNFKIDGELVIPDPASHFQPDDVHHASEVIDHRYDWQCRGWKGRPWHETVFSEVHVGAFTRQGTFSAAIGKLDHLAATGITALELMPLSDFPGRWNWGYDGALLFAPDSTYGRPEHLKALIDAAHARGLMVFLDVVYNHFGPEGNYLHRIAPDFFCDAHTPWGGGAINYERPEVRAFAIENALHWLRHYRFDGLRLDAVHAIVAPGAPSILHDLSVAVGELASQTERHIHLVLENDNNIARLLAPQEEPPAGRYRAQWNDDYHHAWHVLLTHEKQGYYRDYRAPDEQIARVLADGFAYQGEASPHRDGNPRGEPSRDLPRAAFVNFLQNHDQIGNRPLGERLTTLAEPAALEAALAVLLLQPSPPLLFMGEEWGTTEPFPFFCDFKGDLADAIRQGRKREFAEAYAKHGDEIPDPLAAETYQRAKLDWQALAQPAHGRRLALTRALLEARQRHVVPLLPAITKAGEARRFEHALSARWAAGQKTLMLLTNLSDTAQPCPDIAWGAPIWGGTPAAQLAAWSVHAAVGEQ